MELMCEEVNSEKHDTKKDVQDYIDAEMEEEQATRNMDWADLQDEEFEEEAVFDDLTGKILKWDKVIKARLDEIEALINMGVWEVVPLARCFTRAQRRPIKGRWVDVNKGDSTHPEIRSRLVVQETKGRSIIEAGDVLQTFAATPPLEVIKLLLSILATGNRGERLMVLLPPEDVGPGEENMCGWLN